MNQARRLTLDENDPLIAAALEAENRLYAYYGLQPKTHFIPLPDQNIRVRVSEIGSGKPLLIVPGNTGDAFPLIPLMAQIKGRRIIAVNRPGGGMSDGFDHRPVNMRKFAVETLTAVLDAFKLDQTPIAAHSFGGHWSLWLALDKPERVNALTLLGVPGNLINTCPPLPLRMLSVPILNNLLFTLVTSKKPDRSYKSLSFMGHSAEKCARLPEAMADCYYHFQELPHYRISSLSMMEKINRLSGSAPEIRLSAEELKGVQQPTMFLWGTHDPFGSIETGRQIANNLPNATFHAIESGGHLPWLDEPEECGSLVNDFISEF